MKIYESGEMYLESIYRLLQIKTHVRAIDVGEYMGYSKPSVSRAIGLLKQGGFVSVDADGSLHLTEAGLEVADKMYRRHMLLSDFFISIGVDAETATEDACKIEHHLSDASFTALENFIRQRKGDDYV